MLGKLTKYEFRAVGKTYLPLYGLVIALALGNRILVEIGPQTYDLPQNLMAMAYIMLLVALAVITFFYGVARFKKNLLGDEGYLMFTLPVKRWELVMSKLISASA